MASKQQDNDTQKSGGKGNFANDPQRASEEGKKGGEQSHQGSKGHKSDQQGGSGSGSFADNPEKASEAGRKGGQQSRKS